MHEAGFPATRPRRWRRTRALRRLVAESELAPRQLILPIFVREDIEAPVAIPSLPGQAQLPVTGAREVADRARRAGLGGLILFGIPATARKDATGTCGLGSNGVVQRTLRELRRDGGPEDPLVLMADVCLCEYTDHGHCGLVVESRHGAPIVDNDATLAALASMAVSTAEAGADVVAPSDMMDGRVGAIRQELDAAGLEDTLILSYTAKYASSFYGPFREAAGSAPGFGDRRGYQMDSANVREALREVQQDLLEGADGVMVKPALAYLDVLRAIAQVSPVPVAAYNVSGEYAMVKAAAARGWLEEERGALEILLAIRRAGADLILTYWALEAAGWLSAGVHP
jgi:porphobilinogen synthase